MVKIFGTFEGIKPYTEILNIQSCGLLGFLLPGASLYLISAVRYPFLCKRSHQIYVILDTD